MFPSKFLQFPSILTHFHAANEKIQNGGRDLAISRGLVWVKSSAEMIWIIQNKTSFVLEIIYLNHMRHFNKQISEKVQIYLLLPQNNSARGWLMYLLRITPRVDGFIMDGIRW